MTITYLGVLLVIIINIDSDFDQLITDYTYIYQFDHFYLKDRFDLFSPTLTFLKFKIKSINGIVLCLYTVIYN